MKLLITGGSGYLGSALTQTLLTSHQDVSRETSKNNLQITWVSRDPHTSCPSDVQLITYEQLATTEQSFDVIINLAGAGVADKRWSDTRKQVLYDSRLQPTQTVLDYINRIEQKPKLFISSSAIGWYGKQEVDDHTALTESHDFVSDDFSHQLCDSWEKLALSVTNNSGIPVAIIRTGVVLSAKGGMIDRLKLPFSLGLGGRLGDGQQMMSWISLNDWVRAILFIMEKNRSMHNDLPQQQIYNATAPTAVTNDQFTKAVGSWLNRPTIFAQPKFLLQSIFAEMGTLLLDGQNVVPQTLLDNGFEFENITVRSCFD